MTPPNPQHLAHQLGAKDEKDFQRVFTQMQVDSGASEARLNASAQFLSQLRAQGAGNSSGNQQVSSNQNRYYGDSSPNYPLSQNSGYPSNSTPLLTQQQSQHSSPMMAEHTGNIPPARHATHSAQSNSDRTTSLLNLLKFSGGGLNQSAPISLPQTTSAITEGHTSFGASNPLPKSDGRSASSTTSADLMAAIMGNSNGKAIQPSQPSQSQAVSQASSRQPSATFRPQSIAPSQDTQQYLLKLLHKKPAQTQSSHSPDSPAKELNEAAASDLAHLSQNIDQPSLENDRGKSGQHLVTISEPAVSPAQPRFTYQSPFDELHKLSRSSSHSQSPSPAISLAPKPSLQILKHPRHDATVSCNRKDEEQDRTTGGPAFQHCFEASNPASPIAILPDGRTELEALIGIGASNKGKETVAGALNEVGEVVNKQVEAALEEAEKEEAQAEIEKDMRKLLNAKNDEEFEASAKIAAQAIKKELDKDGNEHVLQDSLPTPVADAVKEIIDETALGPVADCWESADAEDDIAKDTPLEHVVKVYNFPMKPFITLTIFLPLKDRATIRGTMSVARLKKDFDQIDRTLVTATDTFMIYCMPKTGGIRIIHQGNGNNSRLFSKHDDRIFSVAASTSGDTEVVMGTGVSNNVYWAIISQGEYDEEFVPETKSFALPPSQVHDGESPGVLKTRVRKSGSHIEFFAVGRGKSIHIIQPDIILKNKSYFLNSGDRTVDTEKYLNDHAMVINTGKAGKDFTFSPDDTMIASLDKAGKVKLWDIRPFTNKWISPEAPMDFPQSGEIKEPLMTFITTPPSEKSWATSVMFVDKVKPYQKGGPLRYLIIGMKQNHTLQLWDLALGRVVQEINLPHENESDAVCSVLYHAPTSIIIVGHPTRNSIYFIHLSAPRYGLSRAQNQAEYVQHLISRDASALRPESTAVMSGIREFSFSTGNDCVLRSLDILADPTSCNPRNNEPAVLFELYAMHSKGMTCIPIKQDDLGWTADNRVIFPVDAEEAGRVKIEDLKTTTESSVVANGSSTAPSGRTSSRLSSVKETASRDAGGKKASSNRGDRSSDALAAMRTANPATKVIEKASLKANGNVPEPSSSAEKTPRNRKKKNNTASGSLFPLQPILKNESSPMEHPTILARNGSPVKSQKSSVLNSAPQAVATEAAMPTAQKLATGIDQQAIDNMIKTLTPEISRIMQGLFTDLNTRIEEDRRVTVANGDAKHEAVLRLVSNQFGEGMLRTIEGSVRNSIQTKVLPAVVDATSTALSEQLGGKLASQMNKSIPTELQKLLPEAVFKAHQNPVLLEMIANNVARNVVGPIENLVTTAFEERIMPAFMHRVNQTAQNIATNSEQQVQKHLAAQLKALTHQSKKDNAQIASLTQMVTQLSHTVSTMAEVQSKFQEKYLMQQTQGSGQGSGRVSTPSNRETPGREISGRESSVRESSVRETSARETPVRSPAEDSPPYDQALEDALRIVTAALQTGRLEDAFMAWLESSREEQVFRALFSRSTELGFLAQLSPLILLTVGCVVTNDLIEYEPLKKLEWVEKIFQCFPVQRGYLVPMEENTLEILPNTISIIKTRLEQFYSRLNDQYRGQQTPLLKKIGGLINYAEHILNEYDPSGSN